MLEIKDIIENYSPFSHMCIVLDMSCYRRMGCGVLVANRVGSFTTFFLAQVDLGLKYD